MYLRADQCYSRSTADVPPAVPGTSKLITSIPASSSQGHVRLVSSHAFNNHPLQMNSSGHMDNLNRLHNGSSHG
jgi:hypothetical protein